MAAAATLIFEGRACSILAQALFFFSPSSSEEKDSPFVVKTSQCFALTYFCWPSIAHENSAYYFSIFLLLQGCSQIALRCYTLRRSILFQWTPSIF